MTPLTWIALSLLLAALDIICVSWAGAHLFGLSPKIAHAGIVAGTALAAYSVPLFYGAKVVAQFQQGTLYLFIVFVAALAVSIVHSWVPTSCAQAVKWDDHITLDHYGRHIAA